MKYAALIHMAETHSQTVHPPPYELVPNISQYTFNNLKYLNFNLYYIISQISENLYIQSTLVISTSVISNNRLSRRENLVLVLTQKSKIRLQNVVEKRRNCSWGAISPLFHNIFNISFLVKESNYIVLCKFWLFKLFFSSELHI